MGPDARIATSGDVSTIARLYGALEAEMAALKPMWPLADGVAEPLQDTLAGMVDDPEWGVYLGTYAGHPLGFLAAQDHDLLPQAGGAKVTAIRFIFTESEARRVGVGEAMLERALRDAAERGIDRFDAHVSPGHRDAKNFFESHGFKARSILMARHPA